jgi:hypothetical protein
MAGQLIIENSNGEKIFEFSAWAAHALRRPPGTHRAGVPRRLPSIGDVGGRVCDNEGIDPVGMPWAMVCAKRLPNSFSHAYGGGKRA